MLLKTVLPVLVLVLFNGYVGLAADPDPVQDFCIHSLELASGLQCKNSSDVSVEDFVYSGIMNPGEFSKETGLSANPVNAKIFPGLNTLGMSFVRADFDINGINVPHFHPRATEIVFVLEGRVYSGFVDTENRIFAKVIEKGEVMVFPKGLVHFQMNVGDKPATILGSFNSQNPGLIRLPTAIFGSGIEEKLLKKAFGLSGKELSKLRNRLSPHE